MHKALAWLRSRQGAAPLVRRGLDILAFAVALWLVSLFLPAGHALHQAMQEVAIWAFQLGGLTVIGVLNVWFVLIAFDTILDRRTIRTELVRRLLAVIDDDNNDVDGAHVVAASIVVAGTSLMASIVLAACYVAAFIA